jgi:integrase
MASIARRPNGRWRARYRDDAGVEHARHFTRRADAQRWLDAQTSALVRGEHVAPRTARTTVAEWCEVWLAGYATRRPSTVRQARVHLQHVVREFGPLPLAAVRPSAVKAWTSRLRADGLAPSTVYAIHSRLAQVMGDAVHDGLLPRSPCSSRTAPPRPPQRPYVASTAQVWALHDAFPEHLRAAVLLGAFAGLRDAEACGLRVSDVDFLRGVIHPTMQYPARELKTDISRTPIPVPRSLTDALAEHLAQRPVPGEHVLWNEWGRQCAPWVIQRAMRAARDRLDGTDAALPDGFRFHDLRHYFVSLLISSGTDIKTVQARVRHGSARTTLDIYGHLFGDADESTRAAVAAALADRADNLRTREVIS